MIGQAFCKANLLIEQRLGRNPGGHEACTLAMRSAHFVPMTRALDHFDLNLISTPQPPLCLPTSSWQRLIKVSSVRADDGLEPV